MQQLPLLLSCPRALAAAAAAWLMVSLLPLAVRLLPPALSAAVAAAAAAAVATAELGAVSFLSYLLMLSAVLFIFIFMFVFIFIYFVLFLSLLQTETADIETAKCSRDSRDSNWGFICMHYLLLSLRYLLLLSVPFVCLLFVQLEG